MKTIYVPRTVGLFDLHIGPGDVVGITARVSDSIDDDVAMLTDNMLRCRDEATYPIVLRKAAGR